MQSCDLRKHCKNTAKYRFASSKVRGRLRNRIGKSWSPPRKCRSKLRDTERRTEQMARPITRYESLAPQHQLVADKLRLFDITWESGFYERGPIPDPA